VLTRAMPEHRGEDGASESFSVDGVISVSAGRSSSTTPAAYLPDQSTHQSGEIPVLVPAGAASSAERST
jgi:hypothetical protein